MYGHDEATGVVTLTLNRPERMNALTFEVYDELARTFRALDTEPGVRAIVLTGAGTSFCTGGDVHDIIGPLLSRDFRGLLDFTHKTCELVLAIRQCRRPVIAALNGTVAGAGAVIATAADIRIAVPVGSHRVPVHDASGCPAPTWDRPGCCRGSSASAAPPKC